MKLSKQNYKVQLDNEDELEDNPSVFSDNQLGYFRKTRTNQCLDIFIDGPFREPQYYRQVCQAIQNTGEGDLIRFHINSDGGRLDSLQSILSSIWNTDATTEAHLEGACHSAASLLAMNCDSVYVSPVSEMLCHHVRYGTAGKAADIRGYVEHVSKMTEKLFRESYRNFLSDEEIDKCIAGYEMWLDSEEIMKRMKVKYDKLTEELTQIKALAESEHNEEDLSELQIEDKTQEKPKRRTKK